MEKDIDQLDRLLASLRPFLRLEPPEKGWIRALRQAMGMTTQQLASRMGTTQPRVVQLEKLEVSKGTTLRSLERAAQAMGCRVVYALVPEKPIKETIKQRAKNCAIQQFIQIEKNVRGKGRRGMPKSLSIAVYKKLVDELIRSPRRLWDEE